VTHAAVVVEWEFSEMIPSACRMAEISREARELFNELVPGAIMKMLITRLKIRVKVRGLSELHP